MVIVINAVKFLESGVNNNIFCTAIEQQSPVEKTCVF